MEGCCPCREHLASRARDHDDFLRLLFLHAHREASALAGELPEESDQFRLLRAACLANLEGPVGLIIAKASGHFTISLDISIFYAAFHAPPSLLSLSSCPPSSCSFPSLISSTLGPSGT